MEKRLKSTLRMAFLSVLAVAAVLAVPSASSAGTLYKSQSCVPAGMSSASCDFYVQSNDYSLHQVYCRFGMTNTNSWYPSHRVWAMHNGGQAAGSWTSARYAYSPIITTWALHCQTEMNTTSSLGKQYQNQLYLGSY